MNYDSLTGLINAKGFLNALEKFLIRAKANHQLGAVVVINPISFKSINEAFGIEVGNRMFKLIAERIKNILFKYDILAKLESDRFGIILKDLKHEEDILFAVSKILSELTKPYKIDSNEIYLSFNIGLALYPRDATDANGLLHKAEVALADAKNKGENAIGFFKQNFANKAAKMIKLRSDLELAIKNSEFIDYYQPYVDSNKHIIGAEALIRWKRGKKIIPPMEFIPYLEHSNKIIDVEDSFLEKVLKFINKLKSDKVEPVPISVNLSTKSLSQRDLTQKVLSKMDFYNIYPLYLKLEIIERAFMENPDHLRNLVQTFKDKGISFSVDDFGTGYSSLSYLATLPVDYVKIDISFVRNIASKATESVVKSIIFLTKELRIKTIAEGVETDEQFEILKNMGCDYFQGYKFYKPMPQKEFESLLKNRQP